MDLHFKVEKVQRQRQKMQGASTSAPQYNATGGCGGGGKGGDKGPKRGPGNCNQWMQSGACSRNDEPGGCVYTHRELANAKVSLKEKEKTAVAARAETRKVKAKTAAAAKEEIKETKEVKVKREDDLQLRETGPSRARRRRMLNRQHQVSVLASVVIGIKIPAGTATIACSTIHQHARIGRKDIVRKVRHALTGT